jgi:hypothetical protein
MRYILKIKADETLDSVIDDLSMNNAIKLNALHKIIVDTDDDDVLDTWKNHDSISRITQDRLHTISYIDAGTTVAGTPTNTSVVAGLQPNLTCDPTNTAETYYWHLDAMSKEDFNANNNGQYNYQYDGLDAVDLVIVDSGIAGTLDGAITTAGWGSCNGNTSTDEYGCTAPGASSGTWGASVNNPTIGFVHPDMLGTVPNRVKPLPGFNLTLGGQYDSPTYGPIPMPNGKDWNNEDTLGHGTRCAQFAAGIHAGICKQANIYSCKVLDMLGIGDGTGYFSDITKGLDAVLAWHNSKGGSIPTVINYSIGTLPTSTYKFVDYDDEGNPGDDTDDDIRLLTNAGIHVCIAAGNGYLDLNVQEGQFQGPLDTKVVQPARMSGPHWTTGIESDTISVGATNWPGINGVYNATGLTALTPWEMADFSDYGSAVTISAPGTGLNAIGWYDQTGTGGWGFSSGLAGTSYSSPLVAGLVCIKIHENIVTGKAPQGGTPAEIKTWLQDSAKVDNYFSSWFVQHGEQGSHTDSLGNVTNTGNALVQTIKYDNDYMYISHSGIADHATGPFPESIGAGYIPADKNYIKAIARNPLRTVHTPTSTPVGVVGVMVNGVPLFNVKDEYSWDTSAPAMSKTSGDGVWFKNSWKVDATTKDAHYGFCTSDQQYNYKVPSPTLRAELGDWQVSGVIPGHSPIMGWALDGHPIYGPYGYTTPTDNTSNMARMIPGWREKVPLEYDPGGDNARTCSVRVTSSNPYIPELSSTWGPDVNSTTYPIGTFIQDYIYDSTVTGRHLDQYNGRTCVTPEFPNGVYAYFMTIHTGGNAWDNTDAVYPYVLADEYYGYVPSENIGQDAVTVPSDVTIWNKYGGNSLNQITKILAEVKLPSNPFAVSLNNINITITWPGHGLQQGDWVQIRGALQGAGFFGSVAEQDANFLGPAGIGNTNSWVLNDWHMVHQVPDPDHIVISFLFHGGGASVTGNIGGDNVHISVLKTFANSIPVLTTHESTDGLLNMGGATVSTYAGVSGDWDVDYTTGTPSNFVNKRKWRLKWYSTDTATLQAPPGQQTGWHIEYTPVTITPNKMAFMPYSQDADWNITWATTPGNFSTFKTADVVNQNLSTTFTSWANENIGEVVYTLTGPIPSELSFNNRTGYLTGTLGTYETASTYAFTINTNNGYYSQTQNYSFLISEGDELGYHYDGANLTIPGNVIGKAGWTIVTSNINATVGAQYLVDTTSNTVTITLPENPVTGNYIRVVDAAGNSSVNIISVARNGKNIQGNAQDLDITSPRAGITLVYYDTTNGWVLTEN